MRTDWYVFLAAGIFVGIFVYACIFWCLVAYRRRSDAQPEQFSGNPPLEVLYVAIPLLMVFGLFGVTLAIETGIDHVAAASPESRRRHGVSLVVALRIPQW